MSDGFCVFLFDMISSYERSLFIFISMPGCYTRFIEKQQQQKKQQQKKNMTTVMILSFQTDRCEQIVQTQIRLLLGVYTVCHSVCIVWTHYSMVEPHSSNFRVITTIFWVSEYLGNLRYLNVIITVASE